MKGGWKRIAAVLAAVFVLWAGEAAAQKKYTVSGYMTDVATGETLISAAVLDQGSRSGTVTNNYGYYTLTLSAGEVPGHRDPGSSRRAGLFCRHHPEPR